MQLQSMITSDSVEVEGEPSPKTRNPEEGTHTNGGCLAPQSTTPLDEVISRIGFGRFQKQMFTLCGLGWLADNMWLQCIAVVMPRVQRHFQVPNAIVGLLPSSLFLGMMLGALFWGFFSDTRGRRGAFNWTLAIATFFGGLSSLTPNFSLLCGCFLLIGFGVGGNLPVDGALFLEFVPKEKHHWLTFLSVSFSLGTVVCSFLAWVILPPYSCPGSFLLSESAEPLACDVSEENNGWRYLLATLGLITLLMFMARVILFKLPESPKFLMAQNRPQEALDVLHHIVRINRSPLTVNLGEIQVPTVPTTPDDDLPSPKIISLDIDNREAPSRYRAYFTCVAQLFHARHLRTTVLVWLIWTLTSFAYFMFNLFLPKYLEMKNGPSKTKSSPSRVYGTYLIYTLFSIPGSLLGSYLAQTRIGRRGSLALSTAGASLALMGFTQANSTTAITLTSGGFSFLITIIYAILYTYTPEVFDTKVRGTATGIASALGRISGIAAPLVTGSILSISVTLHNYLSSALFLMVAICAILLPIETKG